MQSTIPRPKRRLQAARLVGASALGVLGMVAAEAPQGHFGASNEVTFFGAMYAAAIVSLAMALAIGILMGRRWGGFGLPAIASINVIMFVPALGYDMRVAGAMVFWNLVLLASYVFASETRGSRLRQPMAEKPVGAWYQRHGESSRHLLLVALFSTVVVGGFELTRSWLADLTCFMLDLGAIVMTAPLQTRVVLWMTLVLVVLGTLGFAVLEWNASLRGLPAGWKWVHALFQSITLRSGGFNSVDLSFVEPATVMMMLMWMFIGAAPGSTGGGIKITTLAVMLAAIPALLRNQPRATLMRRAIPLEIVYRAATIVTVAGLIVGVSLILLLATHQMRFDWMAFEVISAVGTVGMSLGATSHLTPLGKWVIIALMFIGRVGPTSLALALGASRSSQVRFPEGRIMVG